MAKGTLLPAGNSTSRFLLGGGIGSRPVLPDGLHLAAFTEEAIAWTNGSNPAQRKIHARLGMEGPDLTVGCRFCLMRARASQGTSELERSKLHLAVCAAPQVVVQTLFRGWSVNCIQKRRWDKL